MKNRNILYGYGYFDGKIDIHPQESEIVKEVYKAYLNGKSLLIIMNMLNERQIEYMPGVVNWNKARVMRILDDKRYLGDEKYPTLIDQETYDAAQALKENKCDQKNVDRQADIFQLSTPVRCPTCNGVMRRKYDKRRTTQSRWVCRNPECKTSIRITDEGLFTAIMELLNGVIANPERINIPTEKENEPSLERRRLNSEITRLFDSLQIDRELVRKKMMEYASLRYSEIGNEVSTAIRLKDIFIQTSPMETFSLEFVERTVDEIRLATDGTVSIVLENKQEIRKGVYYADTRS